MTKFISMFILLLACNILVSAQATTARYRNKEFQLSLFPGISTNGMGSGHYFNKFSINILGGMSAGSTFFELGGVSNLNTNFSNGIQLAGLANVVGSNAFINLTLQEERAAIKEGFRSDFKGIQFAGLLNYVRDNVAGIQLSGGFNINGGYATSTGLQIAGISNSVAGTYIGVQIAGLNNIAYDGLIGAQLALLYNYTNGEVQGLQLALVNRSVRMKGKQSRPPVSTRAIQIGLINISKKTDGIQIGLINIGSRSRGTQIGIINIFKPHVNKNLGKNNTPIGLINIGPKGSQIRLSATELFLTVIELTTGNCYNCSYTESQMPQLGKFKVMNQNALVFAINLNNNYNKDVKWGLGYGFQKIFYNKSSMSIHDTDNEKTFLSIGGRVLHLNRTDKLQKNLSLLGKIHAEYGHRIAGLYPFIGISINTYMHQGQNLHLYSEILSKTNKGVDYQAWIGLSFGIQLRMQYY